MAKRIGIFLLAIVFTCSCREKLSPVEKYVEQAFDSIKVYSLHKNTFNFDSLETEVLQNLSDSSSSIEVLMEIEKAIKTLDKHSYVLTADIYKQLRSGKDPGVSTNPYPFYGKMLHDKYAFISVSGFRGVDSISADNYVDSLQRVILNLYSEQPKGWIIDLRNNSGGWPYAMLGGLGPILGEGVKAYSISQGEVQEEYYYIKDTNDYLLLSDSAFVLPTQLPVSVLIGEGTGSAGELLTLAFRGNPKTIIMGEPSYGVSTSLHGFFMPDSTQICVTTSIMTDRRESGTGGKIQPEVFESDGVKLFEKAYSWIDRNGD